MSLLAVESISSTAQAAQQISCTGRMNNGWNYTAEFLNGRFTEIRWERSGQPPQVSTLKFRSTNVNGEPVYEGVFQGATRVTLVDLSRGNVRSRSNISVGVEEWGWSRGTCGVSTSNPSRPSVLPPGGLFNWFPELRQDLIGLRAEDARDWLRQNNFFFSQTISHTNRRAVERWNRRLGGATIDVVITLNNNTVLDVLRVR